MMLSDAVIADFLFAAGLNCTRVYAPIEGQLIHTDAQYLVDFIDATHRSREMLAAFHRIC
jgi:hypothetical protein